MLRPLFPEHHLTMNRSAAVSQTSRGKFECAAAFSTAALRSGIQCGIFQGILSPALSLGRG
jgi:hypothetical protein